ncbi:MAG: dockerin type I repeat-containing protein, partial [Oscillospiraceae bacterium]|nr:dockerin type I repeat-containing protein [Oscillospiraceae bacterium]
VAVVEALGSENLGHSRHPGDLNRDGIVNAADLSLLKQVLSGSERDDLCLPAADWNGDGERNAADARQLIRYLTALPEA